MATTVNGWTVPVPSDYKDTNPKAERQNLTDFMTVACAVIGTDGALSMDIDDVAAPLVMTNIVTTAATVGCRALFHVQANVALGSYANGLKGYMEFTGTSGSTTGLASGVCAELKTPNRTLPSGAYYPLEIEHVAGGTSVVSNGSGSRVGFIYMQNTTDLDGDFDDNGFFMTIAGLTAGAGHMLSAQSITLKAQVGLAGAEATKYLLMSSAENNLTIATTSGTSIEVGNCTTGMDVAGTYTTGILVSGAGTDGIKITGACTSAQLEISGTDILASGEQAIYINCPAETTATNGIRGTVKSTVATGDISGIRFKAETLRGTSGGPTIRCIRGQAVADTASMFAVLLCGGQFEASYAGGTTTATEVFGVISRISQGAGLNATNVAGVNIDMQTRSDETITCHTGLRIRNEAVGGNGLCLAQGAIYITEASLGGGAVGYECLIDASTSTLTDQTGNVVNLIKFKDAGGTARVLQFDSDSNTVVSVTTL